MRLVVRAALVGIGLVLLHTTMTRIAVWSGDERGIWQEAVVRAPLKPRPWINLGRQHVIRGDRDLGRVAFEDGLLRALDPARPEAEQVFGRGLASVNLAVLRTEDGDHEGALRILMAAAAQRPTATAVREVQTWLIAQRAPGSGDSSSSPP